MPRAWAGDNGLQAHCATQGTVTMNAGERRGNSNENGMCLTRAAQRHPSRRRDVATSRRSAPPRPAPPRPAPPRLSLH